MRRFVTLSLSMSLLLGLSAAGRLTAQDEKKVEESPAPAETPTEVVTQAVEAEETPAPTETTIPVEVQAKIDAARRAVAEAIVAAQDAGLVDSSIDPPPILDILITGRATDLAALKGATEENPEIGVSPEVFGAWFTGYAKAVDGITAEKNVRIIPPSKGLKDWYDRRAAILREEIAAVRAALGTTSEAAVETPAEAPATEPATEEPVTEEPVTEPTEEPVTEEPVTEPTPEPAVEEPAAEPAPEPAVEEPAAEPAAEEQPAAEDTEEPAAEDTDGSR